MKKSILERILDKVYFRDDNCWEWIGALNVWGYGTIYGNKKYNLTHRLMFEIFHKEKLGSNICHHECKNRSCVNPYHLKSTTRGAHKKLHNKQDGHYNKLKTHCKHGHEFTEENTGHILRGDNRYCKACKKIYYLNNKNK